MELELAVRVPYRPGEIANCPLTVIARGYKTGLLLSDRLYTSGMTEENFHHPALMHGWELVADLKSTQLNIQASHGDIITVGGHW